MTYITSSPSDLQTVRGTFRITVDGDPLAPALILSNSLGTTLEMWDPQVEALSRSHRLIRYDTRGHGGSPITAGPYTFEALGHDVIAVLDALSIDKAAFCGISMGGHTGLWLGVHASTRFRSFAVCNAAAKIGSRQGWNDRAKTVRQGGMAAMRALADSAPGRWFTDDFIRTNADAVARAQSWIAAVAPEGYAACCDALADSDLTDSIDRIVTPTLLLAGMSDLVTTVGDAEAMQAIIPGSRLAVVGASHLSNIEAPRAFQQAILKFLSSSALPL